MTPTELFLEAMRRNDGGDHEGFLAMQAPDAVWMVPGAELRGIDEIRGWLEAFWGAFSTFRHDMRNVVENGDLIFAEGVWTGVNDGPLQTPAGEMPATGREVSFPFAMVLEGDTERGQAQTARIYFDQLAFLGQLGLLPEPAAAA
jgi:ketosteroid isomerase-like protein